MQKCWCNRQAEQKSNGGYYKQCKSCRDSERTYRQSNKRKAVVNRFTERNPEYRKQWSQRRPGFTAFTNIKTRCTNPNTADRKSYYDRQITIEFEYDQQWVDWYFKETHCPLCNVKLTDDRRCGTKRSIDRKDNNGDYSYDNCQIICMRCNRKKGKKPYSEQHQI